MPDPTDSLALRFAQRLADRDNPPPPPPPSQEPAAVVARLADWLLTTYHLSHSRTRHQLSLMLLALMEAPECSSAQLGATCSLGQQATARRVGQLYTLGVTAWRYRGLVRYHRLLPAAEDALLLVVAGPPAGS